MVRGIKWIKHILFELALKCLTTFIQYYQALLTLKSLKLALSALFEYLCYGSTDNVIIVLFQCVDRL